MRTSEQTRVDRNIPPGTRNHNKLTMNIHAQIKGSYRFDHLGAARPLRHCLDDGANAVIVQNVVGDTGIARHDFEHLERWQ